MRREHYTIDYSDGVYSWHKSRTTVNDAQFNLLTAASKELVCKPKTRKVVNASDLSLVLLPTEDTI